MEIWELEGESEKRIWKKDPRGGIWWGKSSLQEFLYVHEVKYPERGHHFLVLTELEEAKVSDLVPFFLMNNGSHTSARFLDLLVKSFFGNRQLQKNVRVLYIPLDPNLPFPVNEGVSRRLAIEFNKPADQA